jgi:ribosomal protein S6--L-glutamate ligase
MTLKRQKRKRSKPGPKPARMPAERKLVAILSRKRSLYSTRRLVQAIQERGHRPIVLDALRCNLLLGTNGARMLYRGVEVRGIAVAIPRIGASITEYGLAVVNHLDMMGIPLLNHSVPIARSRDKFRCLQLLSKSGVAVPRTVVAGDRSKVLELVEEVGGLPAVLKLIRGTQGVGVMLASSIAELQGILSTFGTLGERIVLQEFVREAEGKDIRALVVGQQVVGAMQRRAKRGDFRSNIHRGGQGIALELPGEYANAAIRASQLIGLDVAGVDMLESAQGPKVLEVNSSPGFRGLERATGKDIAGEIIDHALQLRISEPAETTYAQKV